MADFKSINDFRKGRKNNDFNEDPTYLSFFFMFDFVSGESPLFNGEAENYLRNVIGDEARANSLNNFKKILQKVNREMPWYWQSVTGLESTRVYNNLKEPFQGAEKPKINITCLENVELSTAAMIDLYKRAAFDYKRWVEVIPRNLRHFQMWVYVTEVRTFQSDTERRNLSSRNKNESNVGKGNVTKINERFVGEAKPFFQIKLNFCEFDPDSTSDVFSELSKNPEITNQKISIFFQRAEQIDQLYASTLISDQESGISASRENPQETPGLQQRIIDQANSAFNNAVETVQAGVNNLARGFTGGPGLGNAHGALLGGAAANIANSITEEIAGNIVLGNVYGVNTASTVQDIINAGSINGILNAFETNRGGGFTSGALTPKNVHK